MGWYDDLVDYGQQGAAAIMTPESPVYKAYAKRVQPYANWLKASGTDVGGEIARQFNKELPFKEKTARLPPSSSRDSSLELMMKPILKPFEEGVRAGAAQPIGRALFMQFALFTTLGFAGGYYWHRRKIRKGRG